MKEWQRWLVSFDTDRVKQYIFATNRLKEIRGASALLRSLDERRKIYLDQACGEDAVVYSAGGGGAALVNEEDQAKEITAQIEREFRAATMIASITGVSLPPEENGRKFGERMAEAGKHLRRAKASKAELATLPIEPYLRLCDSCGQQPAATRVNDRSGDWLCRSCNKKREWGSKEREGFFKEFVEWADSEEWQRTEMADDLDGIGALASPPNYVGFIALDGNRIGSLLDKPDVELYRRFSKGLHNLTKEQTFSALKEYGSPRNDVAPFEIVLIGGDDVLLITAADIAIEVALTIAKGLESESPDKVLEPAGLTGDCDKLTMAGGVVLAHADFPIPAMHQLAEALLKSAKKHCASEGYETGAIDFLVVSGSDTDLEAMRKAIPHRRPYTLPKLECLLGHIRKFKETDFPSSQLQAMYQALFSESPIPGTMATLQVLGRSKERHRKVFDQFLEAFPPRKPLYGWPWVEIDDKDHRKRQTALADLVELYPFVQARGGENDQDAN